VREARKLTQKHLIAIGGITTQNAKQVVDAGADSIAVITALINEPRKSVEAFLKVLG
jgi:thiamine-phosphate pyrophosphorylase